MKKPPEGGLVVSSTNTREFIGWPSLPRRQSPYREKPLVQLNFLRKKVFSKFHHEIGWNVPLFMINIKFKNYLKGCRMALQTLHAITIDDLAFSNPELHAEYLNLVNHLIEFIRGLAKSSASLSPSSILAEKYDTNTNEAYLDPVIADGKHSYNSRIYIHKNEKFIVELNGSGKSTVTAEEVLDLIRKQVAKLDWIQLSS